MPFEVRVRLIKAIAVETGHTLVNSVNRGTSVDLILAIDLLGAAQRMMLRVTELGSTKDALAEIAEDAIRDGCLGHMLAGHSADAVELQNSPHYLSPEHQVRLIERSALITWAGGSPSADLARYGRFRSFADELADSDPVGLLWLEPLALNKLPKALGESSIPPSTWFERAVFRIAVRLFHLRGRQLGAGNPGKREPDALFVCNAGGELVLIDTKAARDGFTMTANEERKLLTYMQKTYRWMGTALKPKRMVVVSSSFGADAKYETRAKKFHEAGYLLSYLPVQAVMALAQAVVKHAEGDEVVRALDWHAVLNEGVVSEAGILEAFAAAALTFETTSNVGGS